MRRTEYLKQRGVEIARRTTRRPRQRDDVRGYRMIDRTAGTGRPARVSRQGTGDAARPGR